MIGLGLGLGFSAPASVSGGGLGPELLTNGDFAAAGPPPTITTFDGDAPVISGGTLTSTAATEAEAVWALGASLPAGTYRVNCDGTSSGGDYSVQVGGVAAGGGSTSSPIVDQDVITSGADTNVTILMSYIDFTTSNISVKQVL